MSKSVNLFTLKELEDSFDKVEWNFCFICQRDDKKDLQNPKAKIGMNLDILYDY